MRQLSSKLRANKVLDKKSDILSPEDMARRNEVKTKVIKAYELDVQRIKKLALQNNVKINKTIEQIGSSFKEDLESGDYKVPVIPITLQHTKQGRVNKSVAIPVELYEDIAEQKLKTGTTSVYIFSDYIEYYYRKHYTGGGPTPKKPRFFEGYESKVDEIIEKRNEQNK